MRKLSLPSEHGGYLTLVAASCVSSLLAPRPMAALGVGVVVSMAFVARGPFDRFGLGQSLRPWDRIGIAGYVLLAFVGAVLAGRHHARVGILALVLGGGVLGTSFLLRRRRKLHSAIVEALGLATFGATAGLGAYAGGSEAERAALLALLLGVHAGTSVPLVRTELRKRERSDHRASALVVAGALLVASCIVVVVQSAPPILAFTPRALQVAHRLLFQNRPRRPLAVGVEEIMALTAASVIATLVV